MSTTVSSMVRDRCGLTMAEKMVLLELADCADHEGQSVYPSVWTIASDCLMSERTVQRILARFRESGIINIEQEATRHTPRVYSINLHRLEELPLTDAAKARLARKRERDVNSASRGDKLCHPCAPGEPDPGVTAAAARGDTSAVGVTPGVTRTVKLEPSESKPNARAREGLAPGGGAPPDAPRGEPESPGGERAADAEPDELPPETPANAHWRAKQAELRRYFDKVGTQVFRCWIAALIPDSDDGETLTLLCGSGFERERIQRDYLPGLSKVLERRVELQVRSEPWVKAAQQRAKAQADKAA